MLAGHPLRWQLLGELARGDHQVGELTRLVGHRQSLVSYHLRRLREAALVSMRQSSADGRDAYYRANLDRCGEELAAAGIALHPGLRISLPPSQHMDPHSERQRPVRVLFLCTGNSARSQMAEVLLQHLGGGAVEAFSAGSRPKPLDTDTVRIMRERGIDMAGRGSKHLSEFAAEGFDYVITLCDRVREVCPEFPGAPERIHWSIPDPANEGDTPEARYAASERIAADIERRIRFLLFLIEPTPLRLEVT
jgi:protein-tyrosine-phosphatase